MGKRRRRRNDNAWWRQQFGGMPVWGLLAAVVLLGSLTAFFVVTSQPSTTAAPVQVHRPQTEPSASASPTAGAVTPVLGPVSADFAVDFTDQAAETSEFTFTGGNPLVVRESGMTIDGTGAGYTFTALPGVPTRFGATVTIEDGDPDAVVAMIVSAGPTELDLENMGVHYIFDSEGWAFQVREGGEQPFPLIDSGSWTTPIAKDGRTAYDVELSIEGDSVTVRHIDGTVTEITDSRIGANLSGVVAWEILRPTDSNETPTFRRVWAD